ncbi:MAG: Cell division control-like protein, partial [Thermoleophilia bacterium]|nr:Cell division control-like protein [Thermoleophilia bacterium]
MPAHPDPLALHYDLAKGDDWLTVLAVRAGLAHRRRAGFPCRAWTVEELEAAGFELVRSDGPIDLRGGCEVIVRRGDDALAQVVASTAGGVMRVQVAGATAAVADEVARWFDGALREERLPREETRVPIHFWTMSMHGPRPMRTMIEAPTWDEISGNYSPAIRASLERSMRAGRSEIEGVALWRGEPGTGKTTALRALAMEWANWCDVHVIVDPEVFLGDQASYLMDVLFSFQDPHTEHLDAAMMAQAAAHG